MAIPEACGLWIEQRVQEELDAKEDTGASLREIGIELVKEYTRNHIAPIVDNIHGTTGLPPYFAAAIIGHTIKPCQPIKQKCSHGHIYFFKSQGLYKIGFASNVEDRLKTISAMSSALVICVGFHKGTLSNEKDLHRRFKKYNHHGEWFKKCDEIEEYIKEKC